MDMKSGDLLNVFARVLRKLELNELMTLRERFIEIREDPASILMIEREIAERKEDGHA